MSYATDFINGYLKPFNIKEFTHRDILKNTNTNCSYGVLRELKKHLFAIDKILIETEKTNNNKRFKVYTIEDKK